MIWAIKAVRPAVTGWEGGAGTEKDKGWVSSAVIVQITVAFICSTNMYRHRVCQAREGRWPQGRQQAGSKGSGEK